MSPLTFTRLIYAIRFSVKPPAYRTGNRSRAIDEAVRMIEELGLVEQWHERVTNEP
ncbi:MAG: hypothetical protein WBF90_08120 [Rivularia sp. (in: cyanobacteria)]